MLSALNTDLLIYLQCSAWIWGEGWRLQQEILPETGTCHGLFEMCSGLEMLRLPNWRAPNQNWVEAGVGSRLWTNLGMGSTIWVASLGHPKFWVCKRLHRNSEDAFLSLAPKCCPDLVLSAFRILSWIKNEAEVCVAVLHCGRQPAPALLLLWARGCVGWMGHRKELPQDFCICPCQPFVCRGASQRAVWC